MYARQPAFPEAALHTVVAGGCRCKLPEPGVFYFDRSDPGAPDAAGTLKRRGGGVVAFEPTNLLHSGMFLRCSAVADIVKRCRGRSGGTADRDGDLAGDTDGRGRAASGTRRDLRRTANGSRWGHPVPRLLGAAGFGDAYRRPAPRIGAGRPVACHRRRRRRRRRQKTRVRPGVRPGHGRAQPVFRKRGGGDDVRRGKAAAAPDGPTDDLQSHPRRGRPRKPRAGRIPPPSSGCRVCLCPSRAGSRPASAKAGVLSYRIMPKKPGTAPASACPIDYALIWKGTT